jgi:hypothetical protein
MLINTFHFHPVAVGAADQFGQLARIDDYDDFVHLITFGMADDDKNVAEVHRFLTEKFIISIHQGNCPAPSWSRSSSSSSSSRGGAGLAAVPRPDRSAAPRTGGPPR